MILICIHLKSKCLVCAHEDSLLFSKHKTDLDMTWLQPEHMCWQRRRVLVESGNTLFEWFLWYGNTSSNWNRSVCLASLCRIKTSRLLWLFSPWKRWKGKCVHILPLTQGHPNCVCICVLGGTFISFLLRWGDVRPRPGSSSCHFSVYQTTQTVTLLLFLWLKAWWLLDNL